MATTWQLPHQAAQAFWDLELQHPEQQWSSCIPDHELWCGARQPEPLGLVELAGRVEELIFEAFSIDLRSKE